MRTGNTALRTGNTALRTGNTALRTGDTAQGATGTWDARHDMEPTGCKPRHRSMTSDGANRPDQTNPPDPSGVNPPPPADAALPSASPASADAPMDDVVSMLTPRLRAVLRRCRLSEADVDDVLQDVWLRFLEHRDAIRHPERVAGWLRTTAVREAMRALGRCRTERPSADVTTGVVPNVGTPSGGSRNVGTPSGGTPATTPGEDITRRDRDQALWRAVAALPARDRLLAHLIARAPGLSYADLATTLGVTQASVGQLRARCLRRLRRALLRAGITAP